MNWYGLGFGVYIILLAQYLPSHRSDTLMGWMPNEEEDSPMYIVNGEKFDKKSKFSA